MNNEYDRSIICIPLMLSHYYSFMMKLCYVLWYSSKAHHQKSNRTSRFTGKELGETVWSQVVKALPRLRVTLIFDHTCPLFRINEIMKPQIPVHVLRLETFTYIYEEVRHNDIGTLIYMYLVM